MKRFENLSINQIMGDMDNFTAPNNLIIRCHGYLIDSIARNGNLFKVTFSVKSNFGPMEFKGSKKCLVMNCSLQATGL